MTEGLPRVTITLTDIQFLVSPAGIQLVTRLVDQDLSESATLSLLTRLRKEYAAEQSRSAVEMARLRIKAVDKFGAAAHVMLFTRDSLEQASDPLVRHYRAAQIGAVQIVDACCGIGSDALALASVGADVVGIDQDALRIEIARHNALALGITSRFEMGDVCSNLPFADLVFFDPGRRDQQGRRIYDVEHYLPPLSTLRAWQHKRIVVKLSPGVDRSQLESYNGRVEFISVNGDLKEAVLWCDDTDHNVQRTHATLLTGDATYHWQSSTGSTDSPVNNLSEPRAWLVEPDPSLLRAGLVQDVAAEFGGSLLDDTIAYFTTDLKPESPWLRSWAVLDWMPFNLKRLRAYLNQHQIGHVTVKKRGTAVTPETLIPQLKLKGSQSRVLVLTRCKGQQIVMICADFAI